MAKEMSNHLSNILRTSKSSTERQWSQAVSDTDRLILEAKIMLEHLLLTRKHFERMRDAGEPWPGMVKSDGLEIGNTSGN